MKLTLGNPCQESGVACPTARGGWPGSNVRFVDDDQDPRNLPSQPTATWQGQHGQHASLRTRPLPEAQLLNGIAGGVAVYS